MTVRVEVLGFECAACRKTFERIGTMARELGIAIQLEKVSDPARIAASRVLALPGVVVDGVLVHSGGVPNRKRIARRECPGLGRRPGRHRPIPGPAPGRRRAAGQPSGR